MVSIYFVRLLHPTFGWCLVGIVSLYDIFSVLSPMGPLSKLHAFMEGYSENMLRFFMFSSGEEERLDQHDLMSLVSSSDEEEEEEEEQAEEQFNNGRHPEHELQLERILNNWENLNNQQHAEGDDEQFSESSEEEAGRACAGQDWEERGE